MKFQPGHSGNPAGRPSGSLNKKTLAAQAQLEEHAQEIVQTLMDRAKNGDMAAMRQCMDRLAPTGRNRRIAIDLPVIKTPEDAEAALAVVAAELAAGNLAIAEASALVSLIDRMLRLAERMWNFARNRRYGAARDAVVFDEEAPADARATAETRGGEAAQAAENPSAPLYSPVNSGVPADAGTAGKPHGREGETLPSARQSTPLPRAA
jgi:hypothetical protein